MDRDRWIRVNSIFSEAIELPLDQRRSYVSSAASGDPDLEREVLVLLSADERATDSFLKSPISRSGHDDPVPPPIGPGDVLCDRFRVLEEIGYGGMGHVFKAFDGELGVEIALKTVRQEIASSQDAIERFRQEVRLARQITHPNVCRIFDLERDVCLRDSGERREVFFLTMEFLRGETLASRLRREGALVPACALHIALQIAAALEASNERGIVHRDIKPGNVMLVGDNSSGDALRAVVTDFGLARMNDAVLSDIGSSSSNRHLTLGTLAYMAPEQLEGAEVSCATDIYGFGLVLFEMMTGRRLFPPETLLKDIADRLSGMSPSLKSLAPELPKVWRAAIEGCLRSHPADRPSSASAVISAIQGSVVAGKANEKGETRPVQSSALLVATGTGVFLFLIALVSLFPNYFRHYLARGTPAVKPGALVYLCPIRNETAIVAFDNIADLFRAGLAQSSQIALLSQSQVEQTLERMTKSPDSPINEPLAREIALRNGAALVVYVTVTKAAGRYQLNVEIQQPDSDAPSRYRNEWFRSFYWDSSLNAKDQKVIPAELLRAVRAAAEWVRGQLGESQDVIEGLNAPPDEVTTANWEALSDFSRAEKLAASNRRDDAVVLLNSAIQQDPQFALAYARLGDLLFSLNRPAEGTNAYDHALAKELRHRLTRRERDFISGAFAVDTRNFSEAENWFHDCSIFYDKDALCQFFRAYPLRMLGRSNEALDCLNRALQLSPTVAAGVYAGRAYDHILQGKLGQATDDIVQLREAGKTAQALILDGNISVLEQETDKARAAFKRIPETFLDEHRSASLALLARLDAEEGRPSAALQELSDGIEIDREAQDSQGVVARLLDRAYVRCRLSSRQECLSDIREALVLDHSAGTAIQISADLGYLIERARDPKTRKVARDQLELLKKIVPAQGGGTDVQIARLRVQGETLLAENRPLEAKSCFEKASDLDARITGREYLARSLAAVARKEAFPNSDFDLAVSEYEKIALHPQKVWYYSFFYPPGFASDEYDDAMALIRESRDVAKLNELSAAKWRIRTRTTSIR